MFKFIVGYYDRFAIEECFCNRKEADKIFDAFTHNATVQFAAYYDTGGLVNAYHAD